MIITKTPLRISFFGGGTDYPDYFSKYGQGAVLGMAINKYVYSSINKFYGNLFDYSIRLSYRNVECVNFLNEIQHRPFRECLKFHNITKNVEVNYTAELPAFTGLGSSSSFLVSLLHALHAFKGENVSSSDLSYEAIKLERDILNEPVGCQDQVFAAYGGLNLIKFKSTNDIQVTPVNLDENKLSNFENHLLLFFSGIKRKANNITKKQIAKIDKNQENLSEMRKMVDQGYDILQNSENLEDFGELLGKSWERKKLLDNNISNEKIDEIYEIGTKNGAIGGKLLGAGHGGFVLLFTPPKYHSEVRKGLKDLTEIPIKISREGSKLL